MSKQINAVIQSGWSLSNNHANGMGSASLLDIDEPSHEGTPGTLGTPIKELTQNDCWSLAGMLCTF